MIPITYPDLGFKWSLFECSLSPVLLTKIRHVAVLLPKYRSLHNLLTISAQPFMFLKLEYESFRKNKSCKYVYAPTYF